MLKGMCDSILETDFVGLMTEDYCDDVYHWVPAVMLKGRSSTYAVAFMLKGIVTEDYRDDVYNWVLAFTLKGMSSTVPLDRHAQGLPQRRLPLGLVFYRMARP